MEVTELTWRSRDVKYIFVGIYLMTTWHKENLRPSIGMTPIFTCDLISAANFYSDMQGSQNPPKFWKSPARAGFFGFFLKNPHFHPGFLQNAGFLQFDRYNQLFSLVFLKKYNMKRLRKIFSFFLKHAVTFFPVPGAFYVWICLSFTN